MSLRLLWVVCLLCMCVLPIRAQDAAIMALAYSKNGDRLAVVYATGRLAVYEIEGSTIGAHLYTYQSDSNGAEGFEWHPFNNDLLLVTTALDTLFVINVATLEENGGPIYQSLLAASWSADGMQVFANSSLDRTDYQTDILDYPGLEIIGVDYTGSISRQYNPTRTREVISRWGNFPSTYVRDQDGQLLYEFTFRSKFSDLKSADHMGWANGVIALNGMGYLGIYDENSYMPLWVENTWDAEYIYDIALRPDSTQIALLSRDHIRIFDWAAQRDVIKIPLEEGYSRIDWSPDGRSLAIGTEEHLFIQDVPSIESGAPAPTPYRYETDEEDMDCTFLAGPWFLSQDFSEDVSDDGSLWICFWPREEGRHELEYDYDTILHDIIDMTYGFPVKNNIVIDGHGTIIERTDDAPLFRFFAIAPGGHLTLRNMTLRGGLISEGKGAAILNQGTLTLDNVTFVNNCIVNNPCDDEDAIYNDGGTVETLGPVTYSITIYATPTPTLTPTPTITPIMLDNLTPVLLPTFAPTPTP